MAKSLADRRLLLVSPCDPGNCHIYFGVQRRALSTAISLARATGRTLVLPPAEWYADQAQQYTNSFTQTKQGKLPLFTRWSDLYDIDRFRQGGVDVIEYHEAGIEVIDRAVLQTGNAASRMPTKGQNDDDSLLSGHLQDQACKRGRAGLQTNFTFTRTSPPGLSYSTWSAIGELYGRQVQFGDLRCGVLALSRPETATAFASWLGDARVGAIFDVGHYTHTVLSSDLSASRGIIERSLRPNAALDAEASRFVQDVILGRRGAHSRFLAAHWRHGDYVSYNLLTPLERLLQRVSTALEEQLQCPACPVFLMTNCRDASALAELRAALPTLITYTPPSLDVALGKGKAAGAPFSDEGSRLLIEQAIAIRADAFVANGRSAVSEFVDMVRRVRGSDRGGGAPQSQLTAAQKAEVERRRELVRKQTEQKARAAGLQVEL